MHLLEEEIYLLSFHLTHRIGPVRIEKILKEFGSFKSAYENLHHINPNMPSLDHVEKYVGKVKKLGINIITFLNPEFPERLKTFSYLPKVIYYKGNLNILNNKTVGIVGTRYPSVSASNFTYRLSQALSQNGMVVVSGGAIGIDTAAHKGANGRTVVVMGCGLDKTYPKENRGLFREILNKGGLILSEFPLGTLPNPGNFPARNRVISALSDVVVISQSPSKSGALITARWALDQGKDIWVIPGDPYDSRNYGSNKLIYEGARPLYDISEFLKDISDNNTHFTASHPTDLNEKESYILEILKEEKHLDEIVELVGDDAYSLLVNLQIKGYIQELPGKIFRSNF